MYLHCDAHASHYLKVMLDTIFGAANFRNEIVWCYRSGPGVSEDCVSCNRKHDTILWSMLSLPRTVDTFNRARWNACLTTGGFKPHGGGFKGGGRTIKDEYYAQKWKTISIET